MIARLLPAVTAFVFLASGAWGATISLCSSEEQTLFTCSVGKKLVSVCGVKGKNSSNGGYLQYKFGTKTRTEIQLPSNPKAAQPLVAYREQMLSTGFASYLRFISGEHHYYVFVASVTGSAPVSHPEKYRREEPTGVAVMKGTTTIAALACKDRPSISNFNQETFGQFISLENASEDLAPYEVAFGRKP